MIEIIWHITIVGNHKREVRFIKHKKALVDKKKCIIIFGLRKKPQPIREIIEQEDFSVPTDVIKTLLDEKDDIVKQTEEVYRLKTYKEGEASLMKI